MSELTHLNRWKRYQIARLQGLIGGLREVAGRLPDRDYTSEIDALGAEMIVELESECDGVKSDIKNGDRSKLPELIFERL